MLKSARTRYLIQFPSRITAPAPCSPSARAPLPRSNRELSMLFDGFFPTPGGCAAVSLALLRNVFGEFFQFVHHALKPREAITMFVLRKCKLLCGPLGRLIVAGIGRGGGHRGDRGAHR